ncbi:hypothetical protein [Natronorubrum thiooxidans]|uniref:Uncharacterized protein n=1 Tax=Natronorubrum thiooxidans TaxID=308853 RepID=A0A1N7H8M0_9EURY|nr:hypothetical protein [Natronorubrum thiooxidans]SIS21040.1 hypothetical protein SAMN05421752_13116 [Natronorubrum thiooxidans]
MLSHRQEDLLIAIALAEFSYETEDVDPELANYAWQLAADRLVAWDVTPAEAVKALNIGTH